MVSKNFHGMILQVVLYPKGTHLYESLFLPAEPKGTDGEALYS